MEAINCEKYIIKCTPTKALKNVTLKEARTKIKPNVSRFHVFDNVVGAHIPYEKSKALWPKSKKCVFIGYPKDVKDHSNDTFLTINIKLNENILACNPNLIFVPT